MYPWALIDLHCDTVADWKYTKAGTDDTMDDPQRVLSLSSIPPQVHWCQFYAVFIPDECRGQQAIDYFEFNRRRFERQIQKFSSRAAFCRNSREIEAAWAEGRTAAVLTIENGSALAGDLRRVSLLAQQGVRCMTLTWNGENELGSGSQTEHGLSPLGRAVIPEMERCGILVDVSHLNDAGFRDVLETAQKPFVATHSNARAVCGHPRNLTDDQIREMVRRDCLIGLNYYVRFLKDSGPAGPDDLWHHVEHFLELGAEKNLALGSDFDGADLPEFLNTPSKAAGLFDLFLSRGLSLEQAEGLLFRNALTFLRRNLPA